jgi:hypothetical protein
MPALDRRDFLCQAATAACGAAALGLPLADKAGASAPSQGIPIVDTHQHLWDLGRFRLAWVKDGEPLSRNYLRHLRPARIVRVPRLHHGLQGFAVH